MAKQAIAKVGDKVSCPRCGENVIVEGSPGVKGNDGRALARKGDKTDCGAVIEEGVSWFIIDGMPAAFVGAKTSHDGKILDETSNAIVIDVPDSNEQIPASSSPDLKSRWRAWREVETEVETILEPDDPLVRNKAISAAYAQAYLATSSLTWLGVAAFASKQVGCGLQVSEQAMEGPRLASLSNKMISIGSEEGNLAKTTYESLAKGNKLVFEKIYPALHYYQAQGLDGLNDLATIDDELAKELQPLINALSEFEQGEVEAATISISRYEQFDVLEENMYVDNSDLTRAMVLTQRFGRDRSADFDRLPFRTREPLKAATKAQTNLAQFMGAKPIELLFSAGCEANDDTPRTVFGGTDLTEQDERWVYVEDIFNQFDLLGETQPDYIQQELELIIANGIPHD